MRVPGEQPLLVFISSVMDDALKPYREAALAAFKIPGLMVPWAFEYTPAAATPPDWTYLGKVRQSNVLVWLAGETTTRPVEREIETAIDSNRPIRAFLLPATSRDDTTNRLVKQLSKRVKWVELHEGEDLHDLISATLADEIIRLFDQARPERAADGVDILLRRSITRCLRRFRAAGITFEEGERLLEAIAVSAPPDWTDLRPGKVKVLVAEIGGGKSLTAELLHQAELRAFAADSQRPYPIFVSAVGAGSLEERAREAVRPIGSQPDLHGAELILDGLDEVDPNSALGLLSEAHSLAMTWPRSRVRVTARPLALFDADEVVRLPTLSVEAAEALASQVAGRGVQISRGAVPSSVREACQRPLFAILLGIYMRSGTRYPRSIAHLVTHLVERSLANETTDAEALGRLAQLTLDAGGAAIGLSSVSSDLTVRQALTRSRLVSSEGGDRVQLALPLLSEYFGAQELLTGRRTAETLLSDSSRLERWRQPLVVAVGMGTFDEVSRLLVPLATSNAGFASQVVAESIQKWGEPTGAPLLTEAEIGAQFRTAMQAWSDGLGDLSKYVVPLYPDQSLGSVGVAESSGRVVVSWYSGNARLDPVTQIPRIPFSQPWPAGWGSSRSAAPPGQAAWPWGWTREEVVNTLSAWLKGEPKFLVTPALIREHTWKLALQLMGKGDNWPEPLALDELEGRTRAHPLFGQNWGLDRLLDAIETERNEGAGEFGSPWTMGTQGFAGGFIWSPFSRKEVLERAETVFAAALDAYALVGRTVFARLAPRMNTLASLPAELVVYVEYRMDWPGPTFHWYLEPLPAGSSNAVSIREGPGPDWDFLRSLLERTKKIRPADAAWLSPIIHSGGRDLWGATPAAELLMDWLWSELRDLRWVDGSR